MHNKLTHRALVIVILSGFAAASSCSASKANNDEEVDIVTRSASPNKEYMATVYIVWGGGAAGYVYRAVNIRRRREPFDRAKGIVLHMSSKTNPSVMWDDNENLTIKYSKHAAIYRQEKEWSDKTRIRISYVKE